MPKPVSLAVIALIALLAGGPPVSLKAASQEAMMALDRAKASLAGGDDKAALEALAAAQEAIWKDAPMGVRNDMFVSEPPESFGSYKPKGGADFTPNEKLVFYCEPFGFTQRKENDGTFSYSINGAFAILNEKNEILGSQENIGPYEMSGYRTFSVENMLALTIGLKGLPSGSYVLRVTVTDNFNPQKTASVDKPFRLVGE
jgi:hypothetical protein